MKVSMWIGGSGRADKVVAKMGDDRGVLDLPPAFGLPNTQAPKINCASTTADRKFAIILLPPYNAYILGCILVSIFLTDSLYHTEVLE